MPKEVRFTFQHDGCWLQETTERHPDIVMVASGMYQVEADVYASLAVHGTKATIDRIRAEWQEDGRILKVDLLQQTAQGAFFHVGYRSPKSMFRHVLAHTPLSIGVTRHAQGKEYHHVIGDAADLDALLKELSRIGTLQVTALRDAGAADLVPERQRLSGPETDALLFAHLGGYYERPRRRSAQDLAKEMGISHTAFLNRLRQAEAKILTDHVQAIAKAEPGRMEAVRKRHDASRRGPLQRGAT